MRDTVVNNGGASFALLQINGEKAAYPIEHEFVTVGRESDSPPAFCPTIPLREAPGTVSRKQFALTHIGEKFVLHNIGCNSVTVIPPGKPPQEIEGGRAQAEERARMLGGVAGKNSLVIEVGTIIEVAGGRRLILAVRK